MIENAHPSRPEQVSWIVTHTERTLWAILVDTAVLAALAPTGRDVAPTFEYRVVNWAGWALYVLLFVPFVRSGGYIYQRARAKAPAIWLALVFLLISIAAIPIGLALKPTSVNDLLAYGAAPYVASALVLIGAAFPDIGPRLWHMIWTQMPIAIAIGIFAIFFRPISGRETFIYAHSHAHWALFPAACALAGAPSRVRWWRAVGVCALAAIIGLNILGQNRFAFLAFSFFVPAYSFLVSTWNSGTRKALRSWMFPGAVAAIALIALTVSVPNLATSWTGTLERTFRADNYADVSMEGFGEAMSTELEMSRGAEAFDFVEWADSGVWIFGHGMGTTWQSRLRGTEWPMVHFGPLNLVLRGGLVLMLAFVGAFLVAIVELWQTRRRQGHAETLLFLLVWFGGFFSHGPIPAHYAAYLMWLFLGVGLAAKSGHAIPNSTREQPRDFRLGGRSSAPLVCSSAAGPGLADQQVHTSARPTSSVLLARDVRRNLPRGR